MESECDEMMIGKFGCKVDLEKLETVTVNRTIEELKEKLRMTEIQCSEEVEEWNVSSYKISRYLNNGHISITITLAKAKRCVFFQIFVSIHKFLLQY